VNRRADISQHSELLRTKFHVPRPGPSVVPRPQLAERLDEAEHSKLTLLSAPAGFGKTTLLGRWIAGNERRVSWLALDERDNEPSRFWRYFVAALQVIEPELGENTLGLLQAPEPLPLDYVLTPLINEMAASPVPLALVLDDYHLIETQPIHDGLSFLLDNLPQDVQLIISTRADPSLPLARLRASGTLAELRADDLRFTQEDATLFLNEAMGLELSAKAVAALHSRTEGWIAGLHLAALSLQGHDDPGGFIESFTGSSAFVLDYLVQEVFKQRPADTQDFLLQTSFLERLSAPLCDVVTGRDDSREVLSALHRANLFITPLDPARQWYRYHGLFADLLQHRLRVTEEPERIAALHGRASRWYEEKDLGADALRHALAASDWDRVAALIDGAAESRLKRGEVATLLEWFQVIPDEEILARPRLCFNYAWPLALTGQIDAAESYLQRAEGAAQDDPVFLCRISVAQAYAARVRGDDRRTIELSERALSLLPGEDLLIRSVVAMNLGVAYWNTTHLAEAKKALQEAEQTASQSGNAYSRLTALSFLARIQAVEGKLHRAAELCRQAIQAGERLPGTARPLITLGALLYEWNDLETAAAKAQAGLDRSQASGNVATQLWGYRTLARIRQAQGKYSAALQVLAKARRLAREHQVAPEVLARIVACQMEMALVEGDLALALRVAAELPVDVAVVPFYSIPALARARLLLAQGRRGQAARELSAVHEEAARAGWGFAIVKTRVLQALAAPDQGTSLEFLIGALRIAQAEEYVRSFLDAGEPLRGLLREAATHKPVAGYVGTLLAASERESVEGRREPFWPEVSQDLPPSEPLTGREQDVLEQLVKGLTYREIARALTISVNTVKTHLRNVYGKLDVHNRREATAKARELNLVAE